MAAATGKYGTIYISGGIEIRRIQNWRLTLGGNTPVWADNTTEGWMTRAGGARDATGGFDFVFDDAASGRELPVDVHSEVELELHIDNSGGQYYLVPAIITQVGEVTVDRAGDNQVTLPVEFGCTGPVRQYGNITSSSS